MFVLIIRVWKFAFSGQQQPNEDRYLTVCNYLSISQCRFENY